MAKRTRAKEAEREAWRARRPWPIAVLGVDPGSSVAGAGLVLPSEDGLRPDLHWVRAVDPDTRQLERCLIDAITAARLRGIGLVLVLEEWGTGGPMGISTWLGLGAARGHWVRAARLLAEPEECGAGILTPSRLYSYAHMATWRSWMDVPAVVVDQHGATVRRNDPEDWKRHATRRLVELVPDVVMESTTADAAEGGLIALYGSRCDEVGRKLPMRLLAAHGLERPAA